MLHPVQDFRSRVDPRCSAARAKTPGQGVDRTAIINTFLVNRLGGQRSQNQNKQ